MGRTFLVTHWHVVSGRHFQTRQALHRARPARLSDLACPCSEFDAELGIVWPFRECLLPILETYLEPLRRPTQPASGG